MISSYVCPLRDLPLHNTCVHFLDVSRTKKNFNFCKVNRCPSTVPLSAKKCPMYHSHPGTCSRLAGKKHRVCTLESEKTYSFRCVFSFSVSSTITNLLGNFWDLISCKTKRRPGVMSCSHWKNRIPPELTGPCVQAQDIHGLLCLRLTLPCINTFECCLILFLIGIDLDSEVKRTSKTHSAWSSCPHQALRSEMEPWLPAGNLCPEPA